MKTKKKKTPKDYEIFSFRVTEEEKASLNIVIEEVVDLYNKGKSDDDLKRRKNDVIMEAIKHGLAVMRRKKGAKMTL